LCRYRRFGQLVVVATLVRRDHTELA